MRLAARAPLKIRALKPDPCVEPTRIQLTVN